MSRPPEDTIASLIALTQDFDDDSSPDDLENATVLRIRSLLRQRQFHFADLECDPFIMDSVHWSLRTPVVLNAVRSLEAVANILCIQHPQLTPLIEPHVRQLWPHIVSWIDYLHPKHHLGTERMSHAPVPLLTRLFRGLLTLKPAMFDTFAQTPHIYRLLFDLWLNIDVYCDEFPYALKRIKLLFVTIKPALLGRGAPAKVAARQPVLSPDADPVAREMAFAIAGHSPRRFYRRFVHLVDRLVRATDPHSAICSNADSTVSSAAMNQLSLMAILSNLLLPAAWQGRDVVRTLVRMVRFLLDRPGDALEAAESASTVLLGMWQAADDRRSLVWALQDGLLDMVLELNAMRPTYVTGKMIGWISQQAMYVNVLRALSPGGEPIPFGNEEVDTTMQERVAILQSSFGKMCGYVKCSRKRAEGRAGLRRCSCLTTCYCSAECQRKAWPTHRARCKSIRAAMDESVLAFFSPAELSPLDARFQSICARSYIRKHASELLEQIASSADGQACDYYLSIDLVELPPRHVWRRLTKSDQEEVRLLVTMFVPALGHNAQKDPYQVQVYLGPLRLLLDGYVPVADGWSGPSGEWRADKRLNLRER
ncbi:hypothetical protein BD626DRAFT_634052 [Schizophyllum amplum]|uniref:MYND-type domain-containing protein n=1 Tax=Schizophyllum amplum TaxID=97359 RepID=A0A550C0N9_9AGAR|nr:hypothetical protein BD626DRAFT_634052 [Auriculariopsis ampla]